MDMDKIGQESCPTGGRVGGALVSAGGVGVALVSSVVGVVALGPANGLFAAGGLMFLGGALLLPSVPRLGIGMMTAGLMGVGTGYTISAPGRKLLAKAAVKMHDWKPQLVSSWSSRAGEWASHQLETAISRAENLLPAPPQNTPQGSEHATP